MRITKGKQDKPIKMVLYGTEGIGKSTFASMAPDPVFIDTEGSTTQLDVARFDAPTSWTMLMQQVQYVKAEKPCQTLVIDTIDWAERMCIEHTIAKNNWANIEAPGYGKGYAEMAYKFGKLLNLLTDVIDSGTNVILLAHSMIKKFEQPDEMAAYDRYELKLDKRCSPMVKEWADVLLFANYKTFTVTNKDKKSKGQGGKRVMYTTHHPAWDGKNRHGLAEELPLDFKEVAHIFSGTPTAPRTPQPDIKVSATGFESAQQAVDFVETAKQMWGKPQEEQAPPPEEPPQEQAETPPQTTSTPTPTPGLPKALDDLLLVNGFTVEELERACGPSKDGGLGYYPAGMKATEYPTDFLEYIASDWEPFAQQITNNRGLPFEL